LMADVEVAGLGVAGSLLAAELARRGFRVIGFDPVARYEKPCGEQVTLEPSFAKLLETLDVIKSVVREVDILIDGEHVTSVSLKGAPKWVIIDKPRLVAGLRDEAEGLGVTVVRSSWPGPGKAAVSVDARGPYSVSSLSSVLTLRLIAKVDRWNPETAWLDFRPEMGGLYWVFPYDTDGRLVNAGLGLLGVRDVSDLRTRAEEYLRGKFGSFEVIDLKGAPIAVFSPVRLRSGHVLRVGEAAGLVLTWSGEGNRPALLSSRALAEVMSRLGPDDLNLLAEAYSRSIGDLVKMTTMSRALTYLTFSMGSSRSLMRALPGWFWTLYVRQELSLNDIAKALAEAIESASHIKPSGPT